MNNNSPIFHFMTLFSENAFCALWKFLTMSRQKREMIKCVRRGGFSLAPNCMKRVIVWVVVAGRFFCSLAGAWIVVNSIPTLTQALGGVRVCAYYVSLQPGSVPDETDGRGDPGWPQVKLGPNARENLSESRARIPRRTHQICSGGIQFAAHWFKKVHYRGGTQAAQGTTSSGLLDWVLKECWFIRLFSSPCTLCPFNLHGNHLNI